MKSSKAEIHAKFHKIPRVRFCEERRLTSYSGLVVFQALFRAMRLRARIRGCFRHLGEARVFGPASVMVLLVVHIILGFRRLRGLDYYRDDPLVERVCGVRRLPDVATVSRTLASCDDESVENLRELTRETVIDRLRESSLDTLTVDFDGSVQSTGGHAEGTAVGFNKKKKGARSYYPLFATVAQTSQFFDMHHRPGNVHDSNGAVDFIAHTIQRLARELPGVRLETRVDSAFYDERIFRVLNELTDGFTCSVPFERFPKLKTVIEARKRWRRIDGDLSYFESDWKPDKWNHCYRLLIVRKRVRKQTKGPLQLDLFTPIGRNFEYKVVATDMTGDPGDVLLFHNGRGSQEKLFGEAKQHAALDVIATRGKVGNQVFTLAGMLAHNLGRELQMAARPAADRGNLDKRPARWEFDSLGTIRQHLLHNAGTLTRPRGELTLTMNANDAIKTDLHRYLDTLMERKTNRAA